MRNHRLFGVAIAVLLGMSFLHQSPSSPHHDHHQNAGAHLGGAGIHLASAAWAAGQQPTPLALGEESPIGLLRPVATDHRLGGVQLASATVPAPASQGSLAEGDEMHIGLLRPAGTRYVKLLSAWMAYEAAHAPPPAPKVAVAVAVAKPKATTPVPHPAAVPAAPVAPATSAAGGDVWAGLRRCESGGNYAENTGNGYYGAYQFSLATWHGLGYPGLPSAAAPAVQDQAAQKLQARSGWGQWPACSRKLRLI